MTELAFAAAMESILSSAVLGRVRSGDVCTISRESIRESAVAAGNVAVHGDLGEPLDETDRYAATLDLVYDLASITKIFSATTMHSLCESGIVDVSAPKAEWFPDCQ